VINYENLQIYHTDLDDFLSADIENPCESQKAFRTFLIAACLDTAKKARPDWEKKKDWDKKMKELQHLPTIEKCGSLLGVL
jgi:hypothetical protein